MAAEFLLWFDDGKATPVAERIRRGAVAYRARFLRLPAVVVVNPQEAEGLTVEGMAVLARPYVRKGNYWLGMSEPN